MRIRKFAVGAAMITMALAAGCSSNEKSDNSTATAPTPSAAATTLAARTSTLTGPAPGSAAPGSVGVSIGNSPWGPILTDQAGRTLYAFTSDTNGTSTCTDGCATKWPPLTSGSPVAAGPGISADLLRSTDRADGTKQVVYTKWPLYYFSGDTKPGDHKGQGVAGSWYVINPDGKLNKATAAAPAPAGSTG